jgi:hypothetical protein
MSLEQHTALGFSLDSYFSAGKQVDVLPRRSEVLEAKQVRQARVLGMQNGDLVLSLPDPPLPSPLLGQALEITFLVEPEQNAQRYGYYTLILDTLDNYPIKGQTGDGVVVLFPTEKDLVRSNLRTEKRFKVNSRRHLGLKIPGLNKIKLLDISLCGLRFSFPGTKPLVAKGQKLSLQLAIQNEAHHLHGGVVETVQNDKETQVRMELDALPLDLWSHMLQILHDLEKSGKAVVI